MEVLSALHVVSTYSKESFIVELSPSVPVPGRCPFRITLVLKMMTMFLHEVPQRFRGTSFWRLTIQDIGQLVLPASCDSKCGICIVPSVDLAIFWCRSYNTPRIHNPSRKCQLELAYTDLPERRSSCQFCQIRAADTSQKRISDFWLQNARHMTLQKRRCIPVQIALLWLTLYVQVSITT